MKCEECHNELEEGAEFCDNCGKKVNNEEGNDDQPKGKLTQKVDDVNLKKTKSKNWLIGVVAGAISLVVIVFAVMNLGDKGNEKNLSLNNTENYTDEELANFSIDELIELYGIEEELLTYEQMDEVVTRIKEGLEDSLPNKEKSEKIHYIIREEYGILNAIAYESGLLIKEGMSGSDIRQVMVRLAGQGIPIKTIRNSVQFAYNESDKNEFNKFEANIDTEGFYDVNGINVGYPLVIPKMSKDGKVDWFILILHVYIDEDILTIEDMEEEREKIKGININGKNLYDKYGFWHIPGERVLEQNEDPDGYELFKGVIRSIAYVDEDIQDGDYDIKDGIIKIDVNGWEFEVDMEEDSEYYIINPEVIESY